MPLVVSFIYFYIAFFINKIKSLRMFIIGEKTHKYAFFIFLFFGLYLIGRSFQVLSGYSIFINNIRKFIIIGLLSSCVLLGSLNQIFFDKNDYFSNSYLFVFIIFFICFILWILFIFFNIKYNIGIRQIFSYKIFSLNIFGFDGD